MIANLLILNFSKTEFLFIGLKRQLSKKRLLSHYNPLRSQPWLFLMNILTAYRVHAPTNVWRRSKCEKGKRDTGKRGTILQGWKHRANKKRMENARLENAERRSMESYT